ncbi:MAG: hypothetical protein WKF30_07565 [Pyrinomonadaceae bacterium]
MNPNAKRWVVRAPEREAARRLARELNVSPIVGALLVGRGVTSVDAAQRLLHPTLGQMHDPDLMLGMREAVARILRAAEGDEPILIYGDYDVDGTTHGGAAPGAGDHRSAPDRLFYSAPLH